jgi:Domain of unknown function (DUF4260)
MLNKPGVLLRLEGVLLLLASGLAYQQTSGNWTLFALLLLVPDLFMLGYLLNVRIGAVIYNIGHTLTIPLVAGCTAVLIHADMVLPFVFIWSAHIGMDRMLGYGLKYPTYFQDTHLQRV